jgi:hypothetical protein
VCVRGSKLFEKGSHLCLCDRVVLVTGSLPDHLKDGMAIPVRNYSVALKSIIASEMASIPVEVPSNLHSSRGEAIPDRGIPDLAGGQKLFCLNHCVPLVEG